MGPVNLPHEIEEQLQGMPMLSEVAHKLLTLVGDEDHSVKEVAALIEQDVYLAARLLRIANSAAFSRGQKIESIQRAVIHLGETLVVSIAVGASTGELLTKPLVGYEGPEGALWKHCLQVAFAARALAIMHGKVEPDRAYTAGLLMDMGMAVMSDHIAKYSDAIIKKIDEAETGMDFANYEREMIGVNHAEVGAELAQRWNLPDELVAGIRFHHAPSTGPAEHRPMLYTLHIADMVTRMAGFGVGSESLSYSLDKGYREYFKIDSKDLSKLMLEVVEQFDRVERSLFS